MDKKAPGKKKIYIKTEKIAAKSDKKWVIAIFILTFLISILIGLGSSYVTEGMQIGFAVAVLALIILIGILFDMIGVAVTTAEETPFHAMASKKVRSAEKAVSLIRNAGKVSNFCNDVIGDVAGVVSGTAAAVIVARLFVEGTQTAFYMGIVVTALIASLTVGGKAIGKGISMRHSNQIVYLVSKFLCLFQKKK